MASSPLSPAQAALSVVVAVNDYAQWAEARAQELDFPLKQARAGKTIPPSIAADILESQQENYRRLSALNVLVTAMLVQVSKDRGGHGEGGRRALSWKRISAWWSQLWRGP